MTRHGQARAVFSNAREKLRCGLQHDPQIVRLGFWPSWAGFQPSTGAGADVAFICPFRGAARLPVTLSLLPVTLSLPSSIRVENLTEPSSEISTCGVVPRMPIVATGVSIFMSPVLAILPATNVNEPLVKLNSVELDFPFGS